MSDSTSMQPTENTERSAKTLTKAVKRPAHRAARGTSRRNVLGRAGVALRFYQNALKESK